MSSHANHPSPGLESIASAGPVRPVRYRADYVFCLPLAQNPVNGWLWGVGLVVQIPTISNKTLGSNVWGAGPTAVVVKLTGPWVAGALINNVFSLGGTTDSGGTKYSTLYTPAVRKLQSQGRLGALIGADRYVECEFAGNEVDGAAGRRSGQNIH